MVLRARQVKEYVQTPASQPVAWPDKPEHAKTASTTQQPFENLQSDTQHFADELGRHQEQGQTVPPTQLAEQADAENSYHVDFAPDPGKKLDPATLYVRAKSGVVIVGGVFKCSKCSRWHAQCASGFVIQKDGLVMTTLHCIDAFKKLQAVGIMTAEHEVFPVKAVLASSRLNDLVLLQCDARNLHPLPISEDISTGETVYCLSHPMLANGNVNGFYTFSQGMICGKFTIQNKKHEPLNVMATTADYGPGSSGGPILNEHGAVVAVACQAIPLTSPELDKNAQMVWKLSRPSSSIVAMLNRTTNNRNVIATNTVDPEPLPEIKATLIRASNQKPSSTGSVTVELQPCRLPMQYYRPIQVKLSEKPPIRPKAEPAYRSRKPLYGELHLGDADQNRILVAIDEPEKGEPKIYVDVDGDGNLATAKPGNWDRTSGGSLFASNVVIDVPYRSGKIPYSFNFYRMKARVPDALFYYRNSGREGDAVLDGHRYHVRVLDENADGRFDDMENGSLVIDLNQDGKLEKAMDSAEYYRLNEPFNVQAKVWQVVSLSPNGLQMTLKPSTAKVPMKTYLSAGYPAPEFIGKGLDNATIDVRSVATRNKYILLDFWASWCGPCRAEFPTMRRVEARYKKHGLAIIGINLDIDRSRAIDIAHQAGLGYPQVFDGRGWKNEVAMLYRVQGIPQLYLLDSNLKIVERNLRGPGLEKRLRELLGPGDEAAAAAVDRMTPKPTK